MKTFQNGGTWLAREHFSKAKLLIGSSYIRWPYYLFDLNEIKNLLFTKPKRNLIIPVMEISHFMVYLLVPFGLNDFREKYVFYITLYITLALYCIPRYILLRMCCSLASQSRCGVNWRAARASGQYPKIPVLLL